MSARKIPLVTGEYYHVFSHGIDYRDICCSKREYLRMLLTLWFYQPIEIQLKLSHYLTLPDDMQQAVLNEINQKQKMVELHAFSLMPNHYHLLIKQLVDSGITTFIRNVQISFSKYYNAKHERAGSLFISPFHAKHINTEEQYLHVSRYIHLQRYSSGILNDVNQLKTDPYSSLPYYIQSIPSTHPLIYQDQLSGMFANTDKHWEFISNQADYQRTLEHIKHILDE